MISTWKLRNHTVEVFTDCDGISMVYVIWSPKITQLNNSRFTNEADAVAAAKMHQDRGCINQQHWTKCWTLKDGEVNPFYPCGNEAEFDSVSISNVG